VCDATQPAERSLRLLKTTWAFVVSCQRAEPRVVRKFVLFLLETDGLMRLKLARGCGRQTVPSDASQGAKKTSGSILLLGRLKGTDSDAGPSSPLAAGARRFLGGIVRPSSLIRCGHVQTLHRGAPARLAGYSYAVRDSPVVGRNLVMLSRKFSRSNCAAYSACRKPVCLLLGFSALEGDLSLARGACGAVAAPSAVGVASDFIPQDPSIRPSPLAS
jgi:hypothetical protein